MQGPDTQKSNVISLFDARKQATENAETSSPVHQTEESGLTFQEIMNRNQKNHERLAKERANANKSVLRSYRIKH